MTRFYVPRESGVRETLSALAIALGVGGLSFYLVRMLLSRDHLETKARDGAAEAGRSPGTKLERVR